MSELNDLVDLPHIWDRMARVEERLFEVTDSDHRYLTEIAQHLLAAGGKRYRPLLALLSAEFGPEPDLRPVEAGVAVELIHVGSLYHDDVIDEADTRRGASSVNANWSNTVAILAGDFLMARASETAATHLDQESVRILAATYAELVEGQTRELALDYDLDHGIADYERVIYQKTASLIRTSARLGAKASGADDHTVEAVSDWAAEVGMVFQIADDVLDLVATSEVLGKPAGSDIREGKFTMPVLRALEGPERDRVKKLLGQARPYGDDAVDEIIEIVRSGGYANEALDAARRRLARASDALSTLPDGPARSVLTQLGAYLVDRVASIETA
ncbi:MAG: polyprenyl synthetase family protein [Acidimicrobiia bacterium]|nr:polyprenyl synthetase family protein [Acidimicrobiia bacterium]MDH4308319.1 polyprenyl synthetase family protein [Acidimicrobiia bacterium]MDH5292181.1 polyprenyl synthetase family protein [Acidimicrobiia bacterium]